MTSVPFSALAVHCALPICVAIAGATAAAAVTSLPMAKRKYKRGSYAALWASLNRGDDPTTLQKCKLCHGTGTFACETCRGLGMLPPGGFTRRNTVPYSRVVGTQWTAVNSIRGKWRHFRCVGKKGHSAKDAVAVLTGACGPKKERLVLDVPIKDLKRRDLWTSGWVTMHDIARAEEAGGIPGPNCISCAGKKVVPCPRCDGRGET